MTWPRSFLAELFTQVCFTPKSNEWPCPRNCSHSSLVISKIVERQIIIFFFWITTNVDNNFCQFSEQSNDEGDNDAVIDENRSTIQNAATSAQPSSNGAAAAIPLTNTFNPLVNLPTVSSVDLPTVEVSTADAEGDDDEWEDLDETIEEIGGD